MLIKTQTNAQTSFFATFPFSALLLILALSLSLSFSLSVSFISPPPAELTVLDVLGGERAIDGSQMPLGIPAFCDILRWYSRVELM